MTKVDRGRGNVYYFTLYYCDIEILRSESYKKKLKKSSEGPIRLLFFLGLI